MVTKGFVPEELDLETAEPAPQKDSAKKAPAKAAAAKQAEPAAAAPAAVPSNGKAAKKAVPTKAKVEKEKKAKAKAKAKPAAKPAASAKAVNDTLVKAGSETAGPFRTKIHAMAEKAITVADLVKKADAAKIPTPAWKINDMLKRGQLQQVKR